MTNVKSKYSDNLLLHTNVINKKKSLFTIHLHNCRFYSHHGLYEEEAIVGTIFELNLSASFDIGEPIISIKQTINYATVFEIVKKHFEKPRKLLETLAQEIVNDIHSFDSRIKNIEIHINKINPPIANFTGSVGVSYCKSY